MKRSGAGLWSLLTLASLPWTVAGQEYDALPDAPQALPVQESATLYLTLVVNGRQDNQIVPVRWRDSHYLVESSALRRNFVRLPDTSSGLVDLSTLPSVTVTLDAAAQRLNLTVPDSWLPEQTLGAGESGQRPAALGSPGMLFNYDVYGQDASGQSRYVAAWLEQRLFSPAGYLSNTGTWRNSSGQAGYDDGYLRYDTFWRYSDEATMINLQVGDVISNALTWSNAVRLGGLRVSRDFQIRPDLVTWPMLQYSGVAAVPGSVDLFINGYKTSSDNINAGPFTLTNVPYINGAGEATVVTTDALGRQVSTSVPFYVANTLLRQGLSDFDFSAGALREDYGIRSASYGSGAVSGIWRYGLTNNLTFSSHGEFSDGLALGGLGSDIALWNAGTLSAATAWSQSRATDASDGGNGWQYSLGYSYYSARFSFSAEHLQRDGNYQDLSVFKSPAQLSQRSDQVTLSFAPFGSRYGTFGLGYFDIQARDNTRTRLATLSWSVGLWGNSNLYLAVNKSPDDGGYNAQLQFIVPLSDGSSVSASVQRTTEGDYSERLNLSRSAPTQGGLGWNLGWSEGQNPWRQADITWKNRYSTLQGGIYGPENDLTRWGEISGSLIWMDSSLFSTNKINDAFIVVNTDGYPDVPVRYENQLIGTTDDSGRVLIPWVSAWYAGKVSIDTLNLPVDVETPNVEQKMAIREGSGAVANFPVRQVRSARLRIVDSRNQPLPPGSEIVDKTSGQSALVGYDGDAWLSHLKQSLNLEIRAPGYPLCRHAFPLPDGDSSAMALKTLRCPAPADTENTL
ncbi:fimbria/pilus outer membrane usher protein [Entomohabitans teleogrylli]|uniref:fimbria/pilus outer membrane usher protein n=1 Tax=Entomohabitans teleogrylli TaxID=1384589 RepID=UPI0009E7250E|nr:fimbria/pilus outer membrane usher protein [Entomohabitans teleogrylli]